MSKPKMNKAEWIQYNREAKERSEFILSTGKREVLEARIRAGVTHQGELLKKIDEAQSLITSYIKILEEEGHQIQLNRDSLHILNFGGPYAWRKCQEAIIQMEDRRD